MIKCTKTLTGKVVSNKCDKTITVLVMSTTINSTYQKVVRKYKKYHVHVPEGFYEIGATVSIKECRPVSKTKSWVVVP